MKRKKTKKSKSNYKGVFDDGNFIIIAGGFIALVFLLLILLSK